MVEIAPFRGVIYNSAEIEKEGGCLVAPPYDVLTEKEQKSVLDLSPHNILHIDYGPSEPDDPHKYTWHERSAKLLKKWLDEGILVRRDKPAIFHIETSCQNPLKGGTIVRHGFVCLMKLEEFSPDSHVRPHEKTFSSHKEERLSLMKATGANLSHVFGFFPDEDRRALELMAESTKNKNPEMDFKDFRGFGHKVWIEEDEAAISAMVDTVRNRRIYIADGHHRYETAINYSRYIKEKLGDKAPASADYVMIYLCPMSDPGLVILPTHRLMNGAALHPDEMLNRLSRYFKISGKTFTNETESVIRSRFLTKLKKQNHGLGLYLADRKTYYVLKLLESAWECESLQREPKELAALDTVILSTIVFMEALGMTENDLDNPDIISYVSNLEETIKLINNKSQSAAFILNPASVEDILRVTEKGLVMPRKSTFFYPKVTTGLVLNLID